MAIRFTLADVAESEKKATDLPSGEKTGFVTAFSARVPGMGRASNSAISRRYSCRFAA
jgi:hypothetical protein